MAAVMEIEAHEETAFQSQTDLIPRATIESIVAQRNAALERFETAYHAINRANEAITKAQQAASAAAPNQVSSYTFQSDRARRNFLCKIDVAPEQEYRNAARRLTDIAVWSYIIEMTELETVMDKEEKDNLRRELQDDPPDVTVENVYATLHRFVREADTIWKRGLANCFCRLDRRFRSHTGWKIGSRVILERAFDEWGHWSYHTNHRDTLTDIERVFFILDGRTPPPHWYGIVSAIQNARSRGMEPHRTYIESEFFRVYVYKNGNCHVWFQRDDLVDKANKVLAAYYGEVLADGDAHEQEEDLFSPKRSVARNFGHFPTPPGVASKVIKSASLARSQDAPPLTVLEPSAGSGNIAQRAVDAGCVVDCVEIQGHLASELQASGLYRNVRHEDFLSRLPHGSYDRVVMNPPFDLERDIDHVMHAMEFLKPDGLLVAVMSAGTEWRETKKARAFRDRMKALKAKWQDLPAGSFSPVGTNVNTVVLRVWKDGRAQSYWW